jgi:hypothetical protein
MKFAYGAKVKVVKGFYAGCEGEIRNKFNFLIFTQYMVSLTKNGKSVSTEYLSSNKLVKK